MNRKLCLLVVSRVSQICQDLLQELSSPHDFLAMSGTSVVFLDSQAARETYTKTFNIDTVPALIVCYRGETPQAFLSVEAIIRWYTLLFASLLPQHQNFDSEISENQKNKNNELYY